MEGGLLDYFEAVGGLGCTGSGFVFDARIALDPALTPIYRPEEAESAIVPETAR